MIMIVSTIININIKMWIYGFASIAEFIAMILYVCITYFFVLTTLYSIIAIKPAEISPGTFPHYAHVWLNYLNRKVTMIVAFVFTVTITILVVLWFVWCHLVCLPWPFNYLSRFPPLDELYDSAVFSYVGRIAALITDVCVPLRKKYHEGIIESNKFMKQFLVSYLPRVGLGHHLPVVFAYSPIGLGYPYFRPPIQVIYDPPQFSIEKQKYLAAVKSYEPICESMLSAQVTGMYGPTFGFDAYFRENAVKYSCRAASARIREKIIMTRCDRELLRIIIPAEYEVEVLRNVGKGAI